MTIPEQVTTSITIKTRSEVKESDGSLGYKLECEAPLLFGPKKLPVILWGCPEAGAPKTGETLMAVLTRGKLSEKYDGTAYWHYQWRWSARAEGAAQPTPSAQPEAPGAPAAPRLREEVTDPSLGWQTLYSQERQVALRAAVDFALAGKLPYGKDDIPDILALMERFAAAIAGTPQEQPRDAPEQAAPAGALEALRMQRQAWERHQEPAAVAFEDLGQPGEPTSEQWSAFWPKAMSKATGCPDSKAVSKKLGMTPDAWLRANPGKTLADVLKLLEAKP